MASSRFVQEIDEIKTNSLLKNTKDPSEQTLQ